MSFAFAALFRYNPPQTPKLPIPAAKRSIHPVLESVLGTFGGWFVIAIAAVALLYIVLRIVGKAIATSVRMAIVLGSLVVITVALFVLSALLNGGRLPVP